MIKLEQGEIDAHLIIVQSINQLNDQLKTRIKARDSFIKLVEIKYNATFDEKTGQFAEKE